MVVFIVLYYTLSYVYRCKLQDEGQRYEICTDIKTIKYKTSTNRNSKYRLKWESIDKDSNMT